MDILFEMLLLVSIHTSNYDLYIIILKGRSLIKMIQVILKNMFYILNSCSAEYFKNFRYLLQHIHVCKLRTSKFPLLSN